MFDLSHDSGDIRVNLTIGEAHDTIALAPKPFGPLEVLQDHPVQAFMDLAVHLDDELARVAGEIGDEGADRRLPPDVRVDLP
jgi:hypothetical protein